MTDCPFCGRDPFVYVDIGVGREAVAVNCCDLGDLYFRGAREPITDDVVISPDEFRELGDRIAVMHSELEAYRATFGELEPRESSPSPVQQTGGADHG
jgi:hypothetical protein